MEMKLIGMPKTKDFLMKVFGSENTNDWPRETIIGLLESFGGPLHRVNQLNQIYDDKEISNLLRAINAGENVPEVMDFRRDTYEKLTQEELVGKLLEAIKEEYFAPKPILPAEEIDELLVQINNG